MNTIIRNGRIIDPANKRDEVADLLIVDGRFASLSQLSTLNSQPDEIDASNLIVCPGLIDLHVHLREPGFGWKETIESGARAAAAGGFTTIVCMPNTSPVADSPSTIAWIKDRAAEVACVNVLPTGAISKGLMGEELAPIGSLRQAGVVAITDDGRCVQNNELMRRAVEYARMVGLPVFDHCQDYNLVGNGVVHEGYWSTLLGLPGWPSAGEEAIVMRNVLLAELCDHHVHCQHISAAGSVRILREAQARGVKISGEVCPHHLALTDDAIQNFDTDCKMNPPLRTKEDVAALLGGHCRRDNRNSVQRPRAPREVRKRSRIRRGAVWNRGARDGAGIISRFARAQEQNDRPAAPDRDVHGQSGAPSANRGRHAFAGANRRCDLDRSGAGMDFRVERLAIDVAQYAFRWMEAERPRGPDHCRRKDGLEIVEALVSSAVIAGHAFGGHRPPLQEIIPNTRPKCSFRDGRSRPIGWR